MTSHKRVRLDDIVQSLDYGVTASAEWRPAGPKFLRITDIQGGSVDWPRVPWCSCPAREASQSALRPGDIVFARTGATTGKSFLLKECPEEAVFASYLIRVRLSEHADPGFVSHFFNSRDYWNQITQSSRGAAQPGINATVLSRLQIPLPPLEEQRRIAAILDKTQETLLLRRSCLQDLSASLELNLFLDLFGSPATNPKGWDLIQIGDLAEIFSDGPFGSNLKSSHYTESGVRVIRLQNIGVREFVDNDKAYVSTAHYEELSKHTCLPGDILIGTLGDPNLRACVQPPHIQIAINKADCVQMRCAESLVHPLYVMHLLNTPDANAMASSLILGQTRARISMGRLRGLSIPVPPVELQAEFASRVERTESLKQSLRLSFCEADQLKGALSNSFFQKA